jgi:hypothetical protein
MNKIIVGLCLVIVVAIAWAQTPIQSPIQSQPVESATEYTYAEIHVIEYGKTANEKFFIGRLPVEGEAVEMVYIGSRKDGSMRFQLRVRE